MELLPKASSFKMDIKIMIKIMGNSIIKMIFLHLGTTTQEAQAMGNTNSLTIDTKITHMPIMAMEMEMGMDTRIIDKTIQIAYQTQRALRVSQTQEKITTIINLQLLLIKKVSNFPLFFEVL